MASHRVSLVLLLALPCVLCSFPLEYCGVDPSSPGAPVVPPLLTGVSQQWKLAQAQVIIRHGDRTQAGYDVCWPNDDTVWNCTLTHASVPNNDPSSPTAEVGRIYRKVYEPHKEWKKGNCMVGQLTSRGYKQQLTHGEQLRKLYVDQLQLLSPTLDPSEVHLRCDDSPRTLLSGESLMLGMFPPQPTEPVQAVDFVTRNSRYSLMSGNANLCPGFEALVKAAEASAPYQHYFKTVAEPVIAKVSEMLNTSVYYRALPDCLWTHTCHDKVIPGGVDDSLVRQVGEVASWVTYYTYSYPNRTQGAKLTIGPLLSKIWGYAQARIANPTGDTPKFVLWSGHDSTVMPILSALGSGETAWSPYASLISIELYQNKADSSSFAFRVSYNGRVLSLPGCPTGVLCPLAAFSSLMEPLLPTAAECPGHTW